MRTEERGLFSYGLPNLSIVNPDLFRRSYPSFVVIIGPITGPTTSPMRMLGVRQILTAQMEPGRLEVARRELCHR